MKKHILMLKYVITLGITISLFSCKKHDDISPVITEDAIYRPSIVFDSYDNHYIDYTYDASNRISKSTYYSSGATKDLFTSYTAFWYYGNQFIYKTDSLVYIPTNKKYKGGHDSLFFNTDNTIQAVQSLHYFIFSLTNPELGISKAGNLEKIKFDYTNLSDSLNIETVNYKGNLNDTILTWQPATNSTIGLNKSRNKSTYTNNSISYIYSINNYKIDSSVAVKGQFMDPGIYGTLFNITPYVAYGYLPAKIQRTSPIDTETITWEFDNQNRPIRAQVYSAKQKSFIASFRFSY